MLWRTSIALSSVGWHSIKQRERGGERNFGLEKGILKSFLSILTALLMNIWMRYAFCPATYLYRNVNTEQKRHDASIQSDFNHIFEWNSSFKMSLCQSNQSVYLEIVGRHFVFCEKSMALLRMPSVMSVEWQSTSTSEEGNWDIVAPNTLRIQYIQRSYSLAPLHFSCSFALEKITQLVTSTDSIVPATLAGRWLRFKCYTSTIQLISIWFHNKMQTFCILAAFIQIATDLSVHCKFRFE